MKNIFKKLIASILSIVIALTIIPANNIYADENISFADRLKAEMETSLEAQSELLDANKRREWCQVLADGFYFNSFHNAVQTDLRNRYQTLERKERYVTFKKMGKQ